MKKSTKKTKQDPPKKKPKTELEKFSDKLKNHKQIIKSAPGTAFENYSTNAIRKELGKKPKMMKGTKMSKKGSYTPGKGVNLK